MKIKFKYELYKDGGATYYLYLNLKRETCIITAYHRGLYHKRVFRKNPKKIFMFPSLFIWSWPEDREINAIESKLLNLSKEEMIKIVDNVCNFPTTESRSTLLKHIRNESIFCTRKEQKI